MTPEEITNICYRLYYRAMEQNLTPESFQLSEEDKNTLRKTTGLHKAVSSIPELRFCGIEVLSRPEVQPGIIVLTTLPIKGAYL
jgi:hypothetical protein